MIRLPLPASLRQTGWAVYGSWLAVSYAVLIAADRRYLLHLLLLAIAVLLLARPSLLRPRQAKPTVSHYLLVATVYAAFIGEPLAVLFRGDLHAQLLINSMLWVGSYAGVFVAWLILLRRYRFRPGQIVTCSGLLAWFDHSLALPRLLVAGDWAGVLLFAPVLHAVYAALIAPAACAYRGALARRDAGAPTWVAWLLAVLLPIVLFYVGSLWIALIRILFQPV